jgi:hypothetical protein
MSSQPTTFAGEPASGPGLGWDVRASLHRRGDGGGVLDAFTAIRSASFGELVRFVAALPSAERAQYRIEKSGDRQYDPLEIAALARTRGFRVNDAA